MLSITDDSGILISEQRYLPFGGVRQLGGSFITQTDYGYTGQRDLDDMGLMDYKARFYSPILGRFLQPDTIIPGASNPQAFNRYSYVSNNPINFNDPTGHEPGSYCDRGYCDEDGNVTMASGDGGRDDDDRGAGGSLEDDLKHLVYTVQENIYFNPTFGGSSSGCNTWMLANGAGDRCHHNMYYMPVCSPGLDCSPTQEQNYARRFQYPFQKPWIPINPDAYRTYGWVMGGDFLTDDYAWEKRFREEGAVWVETDGSKMSNFTEKTHIFHEGNIGRTHVDGYIITEGQGTNSSLDVAFINQYGGPVAFQLFVDTPMLLYSTADQFSNGRLEQLMNMLP